MGLLPDTQNYGLRMRRECRERLPLGDSDMHHGTCVTHVLWCMTGSLTSGFIWNRCAGKTFPTGACATREFAYLVRGPFGQYGQYSLHWKLRSHWLKILWQCQIGTIGILHVIRVGCILLLFDNSWVYHILVPIIGTLVQPGRLVWYRRLLN